MYSEVNIYEVIEYLYKKEPKFAQRVIELMLEAKKMEGRTEVYYTKDTQEQAGGK